MYRKSLVVILILILLLFSLHFLLRGGLFSEQLTRFAALRMERLTGGEVTLRRATLGLVPAVVILEGVVLPSPEEGPSPIAIDRIQVSISPWSLLTEVMFIKKISLIGPRLILRAGNGPILPIRWDIGEKFSGASDGKDRKLHAVIREIEIRSGRLVIQRASGEPFLTLDETEGRIIPDLRMENFNASLSSKGVTIAGNGYHKKLDLLTAQFALQARSVEIRKLEASDSVSRYTVSGTIQNPAQPEWMLSADASFPMNDFNPLLPDRFPITGGGRFTGEVRGSWPDLTVRGNFSADDITVASKPVGELKTVFLYQDRALQLSELSAAVFGGQISGSVRMSLPEPPGENRSAPHRVSLAFHDLDPSRFLPILSRDDYPSGRRMEGMIELEGVGLDPARLSGGGMLHLTSNRSDAGDEIRPPVPSPSGPLPDRQAGADRFFEILARLQEISTRFKLDQGTLHLQKTALRTARSVLTVEGRIRFDGPIALDASLTTGDMAEPAALLPLPSVGGSLDLSGKLTGTFHEPIFKGKGRARNLSLRGQPFETAESDLSYHDRKLLFKKAVFREKAARYEMTGLISFEPSNTGRPIPHFDLSAKIRNGSPRSVIAVFTKALPITAPATGPLTAKGSPQRFRLNARLDAGPGSIYGQSIDAGTVDLLLTERQVVFNEARAKKGETTLSGKGRIGFKDGFEFSAETNEARLEDLDAVNKQFEKLKAPFSGRIDGRGTFKNPRIEAQVSFPEAVYQGLSLGSGNLSVKAEHHRVTADLHLKGVSGAGEMEWTPGRPYRVHFTFDDMDLKPWFATAVPNLGAVTRFETTGTLTADGRIESASAIWAEANATIRLTALKIDFADYLVTNDGEIRLELRKGEVVIESLRLKGPGTVLSASGDLRLFASYNLFVSGEADLDLFRIFTKEITYGKGLAYLALQVTDRWEDPKIRGGLIIHNGIVKSATLGQTITITSVGFSFNERQVLLEALDAEFGGGRIQAGGIINLVRFIPSDFGMNLEIAGSRIRPLPGISALIDASLVFRGDPKNRSLSGDAVIRQARYEQRLDLQSWVLDFLKPEKEEPGLFPPWLQHTTLNFQIQGKKDLWINNNLAKLPLNVDLWVRGTLDRPVLLGRVETEEGTFSFRRNDFKVLSGTLDFINPDRIRPIIDLRAVTRIKEYDIDLNLVGPIDKFDLILTSDPPLKDENEILCLLTFRRPCKEVETASKEIGAEEASALISGEIQNMITDKVEAITGIDRIHVDPYYSSTGAGSGPLLTVSKRLLEDTLYVTYVTTLDPSQEQLIQMEYVISRNISLIGQRDELGRAGGDLKFHLEFR